MPPVVKGFITTGEVSTNATGAQWLAVRSLDGLRVVLKVVAVAEVEDALELAARQAATYERVGSRHLVRRHHAVAMADGTLVVVLDEVGGGSLAQLLAGRGQLTPGETVTTVAPLLRALADLHAAGIVHGDLAPGNVVFSADGRPLIGELGFSQLMGNRPGPFGGTASGAFVAPERALGGATSPASDVYAMGALGWFCLTGAPPDSAVESPSLRAVHPQEPSRLVEVFTSCLATDPADRPSAAAAALQVFDAATAESVALASLSDPAGEVTRRIRAAAASASFPAPSGTGTRLRVPLVYAMVALVATLALGVGATWFMGRTEAPLRRVAVGSATVPNSPPAAALTTARQKARRSAGTAGTAGGPTARKTAGTTVGATGPTVAPGTVSKARSRQIVPSTTSLSSTKPVTSSSSPRTDAPGLLQSLVDARALAYVARSSALLDVVYAPGAKSAEVDRGNIATALKNGGTYLGLSFVVKNVAFLDGTANTARVRATIVTPAYQTGQPDGRKIPHPQEVLGPCIFSLNLTPDGWRVLALTTP